MIAETALAKVPNARSDEDSDSKPTYEGLMAEPTPSSVKSAERALDILEMLSSIPAGLSHAELSQALGIPKSSLTHLLRTMQARAYIGYDAVTKRYLLDPRIVLDSHLSENDRLARRAAGLLEGITHATGESSALNVKEGDNARVIACFNSSHRLVSHMRIDDVAPLHATSGGKCILANMAPVELDEYLARGLERVTKRTVSSALLLRKELDEVRQTGFARSRDEFTVGITGLAVAIFCPDGRVRAAINVAVPSIRYSFELERLAGNALREAATLLSPGGGMSRDTEALARPLSPPSAKVAHGTTRVRA